MIFILLICIVLMCVHVLDMFVRKREGRAITWRDPAFAAGLVAFVFFLLFVETARSAEGDELSAVLPVETYVCRTLTARDAYGSGVLLYGKTPDGKRYVLTASHVLDGSPVRVSWDGETWYNAKPACKRTIDDSCILIIEQWPETVCGVPTVGLKLAESEVKVGETVYAFGFDGPTSVLTSLVGTCQAFVTSKEQPGRWFSIDKPSTDGMSGGPMVVLRDGRPFLIGNLWGTDGVTTTTGCRLSVMWDMWGMEPDGKLVEAPTVTDEIYSDDFAKSLTSAIAGGDYEIKDKTGRTKPEHLYNAAGESLHHLDNEYNSNRLDLRPKHLPAMLPKDGVPSDGDPRFGPQWGIAQPTTSNAGPVGLRRNPIQSGVKIRSAPQAPAPS